MNKTGWPAKFCMGIYKQYNKVRISPNPTIINSLLHPKKRNILKNWLHMKKYFLVNFGAKIQILEHPVVKLEFS